MSRPNAMPYFRRFVFRTTLFFCLLGGSASASDFQSLYSFAGGAGGSFPNTHLVAIGDTLYGTTQGGGQVDEGTVFSVRTDGSQFRSLYAFGALPGAAPQAGLTVVGSQLYGTTYVDVGDFHQGYGNSVYGGYGYGTVFSIGTDGGNYKPLHNFDYDFTSHGGLNPSTPLAVVGADLYGRTAQRYVSGQYNYGPGTVYSLSTSGANFQTVYTFANAGTAAEIAALGANLYASLFDMTIVGSKIYGVATPDTVNQWGSIVSMNLDGSDLQTLYAFSGTGPDGAYPGAGLTLVGSRLYGTTANGGPVFEYGNIFSINLAGDDFRIEHSFVNSDGAYPQGRLTLIADTLYGTTFAGGASGAGTVFALTIPTTIVPEPSSGILVLCGLFAGCLARRRYNPVRGGRRLAKAIGVFAIATCLLVEPAGATSLAAGDIVAFQEGTHTLYRIDPSTGLRTILADNTHGAGPALNNVSGLATDAQGDVFVAVQGDGVSLPAQATILRVDATTGNRTVFATSTRGVATLAIAPDGNLLVGEGDPVGFSGLAADIRVLNSLTGATLSTIPLTGTSGHPLLGPLTDVAEDAAGNFYAIALNAAVSVDPATGLATTLARTSGSTYYLGLAVDTAGHVLFSESNQTGSLHRFDLTTSTDVLFSGVDKHGNTVGNGPAFSGQTSQAAFGSIAIEADGQLIVGGANGSPSIFRVNPLTGDRTIISQVFGADSYSFYVSVVPPTTARIPEPSTAGLAICASLALAGIRIVRGHRGRVKTKWATFLSRYTSAAIAAFVVMLSAASSAQAAKLVVMATNSTDVPGQKAFTIGVQVTIADLSQAPSGAVLLVQNITFAGGPNGPLQQSKGANFSDVQSIQTAFIDGSAAANGGPPTNATLGINGTKALYGDSWWYSSGTASLVGVNDSNGDVGVVTNNPAADGSGVYTLGPTNYVGPTGYLFQPLPVGNTPLPPSMAFTGQYGPVGFNHLDQPPLVNAFVDGVLNIPLAQIVATGDISIPSPPDTFITVGGRYAVNVLGGNVNVDPHARLDFATNQIVVPEPPGVYLALVAVLIVSASRRWNLATG